MKVRPPLRRRLGQPRQLRAIRFAGRRLGFPFVGRGSGWQPGRNGWKDPTANPFPVGGVTKADEVGLLRVQTHWNLEPHRKNERGGPSVIWMREWIPGYENGIRHHQM